MTGKGTKIRINELARELEVKASEILRLLPKVGLEEKKTHSSSLEDEDADKVREAVRTKRRAAIEKRERENETEAADQPAAASQPPAAIRPSIPIRGGGAKPLRPPVQALRPPLRSPAAAAVPSPERPSVRSAAPAAPVAAAPVAAAPVAAPTVTQRPPTPQPPPPLLKRGEPLRKSIPAIPAMPAMPAKPARDASQPVRPIPSEGGGRLMRGPRVPLRSGEQQPGAPVRSPTPGAPVRPPLVRSTAPGAPQRRPATPRLRAQQPGGAPTQPARKPVLVPGQPIYQRPTPKLPGMPQAGPGAGYRPAGRAAGIPGAPVAPPPGHRRPRPGPQRQVRDREAEHEKKILDRRGGPRTAFEPPKAINVEITASEGTTVKELAEKLGIKANVVIKTLVDRGMFATINQTLDMEKVRELAKHFGATATELTYEEETVQELDLTEVPGDLQVRAPVVTVMGHVDHGKTSVLDAIRQTNVADREAGGITQAIGAYHVEHKGKRIVFIDTPGHEAFTQMRAHGAKVTDIVILVVAADDGVMPQTLEAIDHAKAAQVPIIVAVNKIDRENAEPERVKQQLADRGLLPEEWGGDTVVVPVSAKTKQNLDLLLEMVLLVSDIKELKANPARPAVGTVLEAKLDRGQGPVATVLVQNGTLRIGDYFVVGSVFGKVRALIDDRGEKVEEAPPSSAVLVLGLEGLPGPGDGLQVITDIERGRKTVEFREQKARELAMAKPSRLSLEQFQEKLASGEVKELPILLKCDVQGSLEVLTDSIGKLQNDKVKVRLIRAGVGAISMSDVLLAGVDNAVVVGFNVRPERNAAVLAEQESIEIRLHTVIYELVDELKKAMAGLLDPIIKETFMGRADVQQPFRVSKVGTVAGCVIQEGRITRGSQIRLLRDNVVIYTGKVNSLRRFKDEASEVRAGQECGIGLENYNDIKPGDQLEAFSTEKVAQELVV